MTIRAQYRSGKTVINDEPLDDGVYTVNDRVERTALPFAVEGDKVIFAKSKARLGDHGIGESFLGGNSGEPPEGEVVFRGPGEKGQSHIEFTIRRQDEASPGAHTSLQVPETHRYFLRRER